MWACKTFINAQIVHHRAQRVVPKWSPSKLPVLACGSGRRDRAATGFWVLAMAGRLPRSPPGRQGPVVLSALAPSVAGGLPQRLRLVGPQCVAPVTGCTATFSHNNMDDCPDLAVFSGLLGGHPVDRVEDDGLGEELRVLLAHSMRGHHTANARRHHPPGPRPVKRG